MKLVQKLTASFLVISALIWTAGLYAYKVGYSEMQNTYISNNEALAREIMDSDMGPMLRKPEKQLITGRMMKNGGRVQKKKGHIYGI